ncbi:MAG: TonB-dependent receptor [Phenylobacterium sp.]|nr:TonB-dependent receptor [Phenylobacterium sp.]
MILRSILAGSACALALAGAAIAQTKTFNIPAGDLKSALDAYAKQAGVQLIYRTDDVRGAKSPGVSGALDANAALSGLLANTGLTVRRDASGAMAVVRGAPAPQPASGAPAATAASVEEVVVVGSQIQGAKVNTALPVTVVGMDQIQATAAVSGDELFRTIPQAGNVNFNSSFIPGSSNSARGDVNSVSLRNIGSGNTLVLLNGRRTVVHPTTQAESLVPVFTYNTNAIPVAGLKRVEVLRDGAGAIYGSDAVAGVINTVLQDHYDGGQINAQYGAAQGTDLREGELDGLFGRNIQDGRGNFTIFASTVRRSALLASNQDYTASSDERPLFAGTPFATATSLDQRLTTSAFGVFQALPSAGTIRSNGVAVTGSTGLFHISPIGNPTCGVVVSAGLCIDSGSQNTTTDRNLRLDTAASFKLSVIPEVVRYNVFSTFNYDLTPDVTFFSELGYYNAVTHGSVAPPGATSSTTITIPATAYYNPFGAALLPNGQPNPNRLPGLNISAAGVPVTINSYGLVDVGGTPVVVTNDEYRILGGLRGKKFGFNWESAVLYSWATVNDLSYGVSNTKLQQQLSLTTPDAYNPFNGGTLNNLSIGDATPSSAKSIAAITVPILRKDTTTLAMWDFKISRPDLFTIWSGDVGVATGVEVRRETYEDNRDPRVDGQITYTDAVTGVAFPSDIVGTSNSPDVKGHRTVSSAYVEFQIPLVSPEMHIPLVDRIDVQLAGRAEHYSDVGDVAKPKVAASWDIVPGVRLRASYDEGFRAPNLEQLNVSVVSRSNTRTDYIACEADLRAKRITSFNQCTRTQPVQARRAGNPDLTPETSTSTSYGVVLESDFVPSRFGHATLTVDVWKINQDNIVGLFGEGNAVILDYFDRLNGTTNPNVHRAAPTPDQIAAFAGTGLAPAGTVLFVDDKYVNQLPQQAAGVDYGFIYRLNTDDWGDFGLDVNVTHQTKLFQEPTPGIAELLAARAAGKINAGTTITGAADLVGQNGAPAWRGSASLTWRKGPVSANWFIDYIGDFYSTLLTNADGSFYNVPSTVTHNVSVAYEFRDGLWDGTQLRLGVRNLFDKDPPLVSGGYVGAVYNPYGRYLYVDVKKTF